MGFKNHRAVPANAARLEVLQGCARLLLIEIQREGYAAGLKVSVQVGVIALHQGLTIDNIAILDFGGFAPGFALQKATTQNDCASQRTEWLHLHRPVWSLQASCCC